MLEDPADAIRRLTHAWRQRHPKRAFGGAWALAGFSFQAAVFLLDFYRNLIDAREAPSIERISDVLCPAGGSLHVVVQTKRTLTRSGFPRVLEEFALIIAVCRESVPELLDDLRFQIVCHGLEDPDLWPC